MDSKQPSSEASAGSRAAGGSAAALQKINECGNWLMGVREYVIANKMTLALGRAICLQAELDELKAILGGNPPNPSSQTRRHDD